MVRLVMLVALLVANLTDAPGISWINYAILVYDIISAAIARFAGLTKSTKIHDTAFFYHGLYLQPNTPICFLVSNPHITQFSILGNQKLKKQIIYNINLFCSTFCESYTKSINNDTNYSNS